MSNIPKAMARLSDALVRIEDAKQLVKEAMLLMPRARNQPRAPATAKKVTPQTKADIKRLRQQYPKMAMREIGRRTGVDQGRVSEVLNGLR